MDALGVRLRPHVKTAKCIAVTERQRAAGASGITVSTLLDGGEGAHDLRDRFPVGTRVRVLPNHACATGAQHDRYHILDGKGRGGAVWPRINGW